MAAPPRTPISRRALVAGTLAAAGMKRVGAATSKPDVAVVGAGVFGAWTARELQRRGRRVLLVDAIGPAHAGASSGGESRMTRGLYGGDEVYTRMALDSLEAWKALSDRSALPLFHPTGVLMFFDRDEPFARTSRAAHVRLGLPLQELSPGELEKTYPQVRWDGIAFGLLEPGFGVLMARRAVQTLVAEFIAAGGDYLQEAVLPPTGETRIESLATRSGAALIAGDYVFACGPWLPKLFPGLLGGRIFPTRQEVFFFAPPPGDARFEPGRLPGWADFNSGDIYYGMPNLESRGFKIARDRHGPAADPDTLERQVSADGLADIRAYLARRFPALAAQPLVESRVCQYENSSNGDLLIDRHPALANAWLVGAGSGHGFKHGPAVGRYVAELVLGENRSAEPRFSLASKATVQDRNVH